MREGIESKINFVSKLWEKTLKEKHFDIEDNFFDLGGTSLQAIEIVGKICEEYNFEISDFFINPTIKSIASHLKDEKNGLKKYFDIFKFKKIKDIDKKEFSSYENKITLSKTLKFNKNRYTNIFLLGSTGFLGCYLLKELMLLSNNKIYTLVRSSSNETASLRLKKALDYYFGENFYKEYHSRIVIYDGDLLENNFGLSENDYIYLANTVDVIINSAALVKHMGKSSEFNNINVNLVDKIIKFAQIGIKKDIHHMSTIGVIYGDNSSIENTIFTEFDESYRCFTQNQYLNSKYKSEMLLYKARELGISSSIYRMSGILFDSTNGKFQRNIDESTVYIFFKNLLELGIIPKEISPPMDISCVDKISEAISLLIMSDGNVNKTYHIINSNKLSIKEILKLISRVRGNKNELIEMSRDEMYELYKLGGEKVKEKFKKIIFECEIINEIRKNTLNICTEKTMSDLKSLGFEWNKINENKMAYLKVNKE